MGAAASRSEIYDYSGRLMRDLHFPAAVLPTHRDNFTAPFGASQQPSLGALQPFLEEIKAASPKTKVMCQNISKRFRWGRLASKSTENQSGHY